MIALCCKKIASRCETFCSSGNTTQPGLLLSAETKHPYMNYEKLGRNKECTCEQGWHFELTLHVLRLAKVSSTLHNEPIW